MNHFLKTLKIRDQFFWTLYRFSRQGCYFLGKSEMENSEIFWSGKSQGISRKFTEVREICTCDYSHAMRDEEKYDREK